jgi:hypothetical protein
MSEGFLTRWSRRKRALTSPRLRGEVGSRSDPGEGVIQRAELAEQAPHPDPLPASGERESAPPTPNPSLPRASRAGGGEPEGAAREASGVDSTNLPPIESIGAGSDVSAFLRPGVPADLARAALRRAWVADPAIRDFVGLAENAWDFNAPGGVPGFGPLRAVDDALRLAAQLAGATPAAVGTADAAKERSVPAVGQRADAAEQPPAQAVSADPAIAAVPAAPPSGDDAAAPKDVSAKQPNVTSPGRRHGGALAE